MDKIIIIGAGIHAECVMANILEEKKYEIFGLLDLHKTGEVMGFPILGTDDLLPALKAKGVRYAFPGAVIGNKADTRICQRIVQTIKAAGLELPNLISSQAVVRKTAVLGQGVLVQPMAVVDVATTIGNGVAINPNVLVGHHCRVEDYVVFAGSSVVNANVTIAEGAFIGMGARIFANVGKWSKVAPGATVMEPVPDYHIAFGEQARIMKRLV